MYRDEAVSFRVWNLRDISGFGLRLDTSGWYSHAFILSNTGRFSRVVHDVSNVLLGRPARHFFYRHPLALFPQVICRQSSSLSHDPQSPNCKSNLKFMALIVTSITVQFTFNTSSLTLDACILPLVCVLVLTPAFMSGL